MARVVDCGGGGGEGEGMGYTRGIYHLCAEGCTRFRLELLRPHSDDDDDDDDDDANSKSKSNYRCNEEGLGLPATTSRRVCLHRSSRRNT
mmetsp:Transcript_64074/g.71762  ORF Transcript_64074/g.71762 Transcript_64074/m.71762 type:complete len:90 (+) Transcript_64074:353-622(+)